MVLIECIGCSESREKVQEGFGHTKTKLGKFLVPLELLELMNMW